MHIDVQAFAQDCACGKPHTIFVKDILIEQDAIARIPALLAGEPYRAHQKRAVICDDNTYRAAGKRVHEQLTGSVLIKLCPDNLHADEHAVETVEHRLPKDMQLLIAVGSGTIHDIVRYVAHARGIPFVSVPTAASVDGFVSTVAAMTWHGFKKSFIAVSPICVVADSTIIAQAPRRLTAAGVSDLLGKYTAIADWRIAHLVTGEYLCERVCGLELQALENLRGCLDAIRAGGIEAYEQLMYGLLLSGLAMQMVGNSRPASGAEHHMSHLWEMEVLNGHVDAYHGEKVGVGLMLCAGIYRDAARRIRAGGIAAKASGGVETELLRAHFSGSMLEEILQENACDPLGGIDPKRLDTQLLEIAELLEAVPAPEEIETMIAAVGGVCTLSDIGLDASVLEGTMQLSPYVRNRLTFMRLRKLLYSNFINERD